MPYLRTEDSEICYTDTGPGTGPPIVLVHGWTADSVDWSWLIPALTEEEAVPAIRSYLGATWFSDTTPDWLTTLVFRRVETLSPTALHGTFCGMWDDLDIAFRPDTDDNLARRECPVLVINQDASMAAYEETTFRHPASRAVVMSGGGHWLQIERAPDVAAEITKWWSTAHPAR